MELYRLARKKYAEPLNGLGASLSSNNRWNSRGTEIIYTASSRALATLEVYVHLMHYELPTDYVMLTIFVPDDVAILIGEVEDIWSKRDTQVLGDQFVKNNHHLIMRVPSAIVPRDFNVLINPFHEQFSRAKVVEVIDFPFDKRLFNK